MLTVNTTVTLKTSERDKKTLSGGCAHWKPKSNPVNQRAVGLARLLFIMGSGSVIKTDIKQLKENMLMLYFCLLTRLKPLLKVLNYPRNIGYDCFIKWIIQCECVWMLVYIKSHVHIPQSLVCIRLNQPGLFDFNGLHCQWRETQAQETTLLNQKPAQQIRQ